MEALDAVLSGFAPNPAVLVDRHWGLVGGNAGVALLTAGVDTTVNGLGAALYCLARYPEQWQKLRQDPTLARAAFEEAVRFESPVQTFFRTTTRPARIGEVEIDEGQKVLMFLGAANRDPARFHNPDQLDIDLDGYGDACDDCTDLDYDGICDDLDACPGTYIPESVPYDFLGVNHFALVDGDHVFDTRPPPGHGFPKRIYTIADTAGCNNRNLHRIDDLRHESQSADLTTDFCC